MQTINESIRPAAGEISPAAGSPGTWHTGDYAVIGSTLQIVGETLAESMHLTPGSRVLDVAAGNGNASLAFARRWHRVTSTDRVPAILGAGATRAKAEGLAIDFRLADAESLPFDNGSFDAVVSTFGVMFARDQRRAAAELVRVCRGGGSIGLASWTPDSFVGELGALIARYCPTHAARRSPYVWGDTEWIGTVFGDVVSSIRYTPRTFAFRYRDTEHFIGVFKTGYGPIRSVLGRLDGIARRLALREIRDLLHRRNTAADGSIQIPAEYLEAVITR